MTTYPRLLDFAGWALVVLAGCVVLVAILGIVAVLHASTPSAVARAEEKLHESHYVVQPSRTTVIPLTVCLALAGLVGCMGYSMTHHFVKRKILAIESKGLTNGSGSFHERSNN